VGFIGRDCPVGPIVAGDRAGKTCRDGFRSRMWPVTRALERDSHRVRALDEVAEAEYGRIAFARTLGG